MLSLLALVTGAGLAACLSAQPPAPNVILILADDLGYGDLGSYGQKLIRTPNLDRMASEGLRFTQFYAGSTVCAPSRCVLMTGRHTGRAWVRGNAGGEAQTLQEDDKTVAEVFQEAGYATGQFGKWGLGDVGTTGHPNRQGFDQFYGYLGQRHAHNYYPTFLFRNEERVKLRNVPERETEVGAGYAREKVDYSHDLIVAEAMEWLEQNRKQPFFLFLSLTIPHANNEATRPTGNGQEVPDHGIYADEDWPEPDKGQAAMITRMDRDIGRLLRQLEDWGIDEQTLVLFSSDNGHHREGGNNPELFDANGPLRGMKRSLYEGGIRVPTIAWWPSRIEPGTSDHIGYFGDLFATACELTGQPVPEGLDSLSFLPTMLGSEQKEHKFLYWEFYEQGSRQAVRFDNWKAVRQPMFDGEVELYDLSVDLGEQSNLAEEFPDRVAEAVRFMEQAHVPNSNWRVRGRRE